MPLLRKALSAASSGKVIIPNGVQTNVHVGSSSHFELVTIRIVKDGFAGDVTFTALGSITFTASEVMTLYIPLDAATTLTAESETGGCTITGWSEIITD